MNSRHYRIRREGGFIQGTILFALAILGVIIAAFAVSNTGSSTSTDTERARVNAGVIMKAGSDLQDAVSRALADQHPGSSIALTGTTNLATPLLNLFDINYRYGAAPRLPDQAFASNTAGLFTRINNDSIAGGSTNDLIVQLPGLRLDVCNRINNLSLGGAFDAAATPPADIDAAVTARLTTEGCFGNATDNYTYFRLVATDIN